MTNLEQLNVKRLKLKLKQICGRDKRAMKVSWHVWRTHQLVGEAHHIPVTCVASFSSQTSPSTMKLEVVRQAFRDGPTHGYRGVMMRLQQLLFFFSLFFSLFSSRFILAYQKHITIYLVQETTLCKIKEHTLFQFRVLLLNT